MRLRLRLPALLSACAVTVPLAVLLPVVSAPAATPHPVKPSFQYVPLGGVDATGLAQLGLRTAAQADVPGPSGHLAVLTAQETVRPYRLVGLTWTGTDPTSMQVRTRAGGTWSAWNTLEVSDAAPQPGSPEAKTVRRSTDPLIAPGADGVQVRVETADGLAPTGLRLALVNPGTSAADGEHPKPLSAAQAAAGMPAIVTRAQWGADESLRDPAFKYTTTVKTAFIHHTASGNGYFASGYSMAAAEQDIRAIYAYATGSAGYADMPYHFLVDQGGTIYEGRAGGMDKPVLGAATGGFNTNTMAVAALGNFSTAHPSAALLSGIEKVVAWKLGLFHVDPLGTTVLTSSGGTGTTDRYGEGVQVRVNDISGHRDVGQTACPGGYLYPYLPTIRAAVRTLQQSAFYDPVETPGIAPNDGSTAVTVGTRTSMAMTYQLQVMDSTGNAVRTIKGATGAAGALTITWNLRGDGGGKLPDGTYTLTLTGGGSTGSAVPWTTTVLVGTPDVPTTVPLPTVYWKTGTATAAGRQWSTTCVYQSLLIERCQVQIMSSWFAPQGGTYVSVKGWLTNDFTYIAYDSPSWTGNVLSTPGAQTVLGRQYQTTCTPSVGTGTRQCLSYILGSVVTRTAKAGGGYVYKVVPFWRLNSITYLLTRPSGP